MSRAPSDGRPWTNRGQNVLNLIARGMLRTPLLSRVVGRAFITLYVVGRKTGKRYVVPMAYQQYEGALLLASGFAWAKNLRTGGSLEVDFKGRRRVADVRVFTDEATVTEHYAVIVRRNPQFGKLNRIGVDRDGAPLPEDLRAAWAAGGRTFLLSVR